MEKFQPFHGMITMINDFWIGANEEGVGCYKLMSVENGYGALVNFVVTPTTYFVDHVMVTPGDMVTGFYDANAPVPLIFPPQFRAIVMARDTQHQNVKVDYFNDKLVSSDNNLRLNIAPTTQIVLENGQSFSNSPANRNLIIVYGATTKSIPAQTTPYKIIVMC
ncbi:hypothetical protein K2F40_09400 [Clostridium sp. CM028]|uniref:hypothetical protein n=1 Tax=unclassified Clostridium TaxID=2614128 RepID=UPI001C0AF599|nr:MULTISPECIES: hypothetical protein [unclassified Clostridium]MBU3093011.1 hypothetical protein [Clostridium sp. CF011]MBW9146435.1 hypothetical protein [Clostridium sp. CM027]MBW9149174.1 hypothetical protein [Clostridium sp. CM028]UVE41943.1 hypothetical protein KTC92_05635 [Clostridium sp. CM027]WAG70956.1 hypothetical protein LL036_05875 [Clostridium sp. CF011]